MKNLKFIRLITPCILIALYLLYINKQFMAKSLTCEDLSSIFPKTPEDVSKIADQCIKDINAQIEKIIIIPDNKRNFENTAYEFDKIFFIKSQASGLIGAMGYLSPDEKLREATFHGTIKLENFFIDNVLTNPKLYQAFKIYTENNAQNEPLDKTQKYFIDETMLKFKKNGLNLPEEKINEVRKLSKEITELAIRFEGNIAQDKKTIAVNQNDLTGLSKEFIESLNKDSSGLYILGCDIPTYFTVMGNCSNQNVRKNLFLNFTNRAYPVNLEILHEIIETRDKLAKLVGFKNFADYTLSELMIKSTENAELFLNDLINKAHTKIGKETEKLCSDLPESVILNKNKINPWDNLFLKETYKKKKLNLDETKIAEYFPMDNTIEKLLYVYEQFLNIKFKKISCSDSFWHTDVKLIAIHNKHNQLLGYLLLDLYPRANKITHSAAHLVVIPSIITPNNENNVSVSIVMANFPKPTQTQPSLLKFKDVITFFHEFGHALHAILGRTKLASFSGTNVKSDFVEMPSQMLEDWLKDPAILKMVSKHYKNGNPLSDELISKMIALEKFDSADYLLSQAFLAKLLLEFSKNSKIDTDALTQILYNDILIHIHCNSEYHIHASFVHIIWCGPSYYGYLWSKVFAKDLFSEIKKHGLLNPIIGQEYVDKILSKGGSVDPNELLYDFLGRNPNPDAFLNSLGL